MRFSKKLKYITGLSLASLMLLSFGGTPVANADTSTSATSTHIELTPQLLKAYVKFMGPHYHISPSLARKIAEHNFNAMHKGEQKQFAKSLAQYKSLMRRYSNDLSIADSPKADKQNVSAKNADIKKIQPDLDKAEATVSALSKSPNHVRHMRKSSPSQTINQFQHQILNDINYDREQHNLAPVKLSKSYNKLALMRSDQLETNYSHYDKSHKALSVEDAKQMHLNWTPGLEENINELDYGGNWEPTGQYYQPKNGLEMANETEDSMINHDVFTIRAPGFSNQGYHENNGHHDNILNPKADSVGISVSYDAKTKTYFIAEEFHVSSHANNYHGKNQYKNYIHDLG